MGLVNKNAIDRTGGLALDHNLITHAFELLHHGIWRVGPYEQFAWFAQVVAKRTVSLVVAHVRGFAGLLHVHAKLDHVEKELQQILILKVTALYSERQKWLAIF